MVNIVKNFLIVLKKSTMDALKTTSKRAVQKTAEATANLIGKTSPQNSSNSAKCEAEDIKFDKEIPK